MGYSVIDKEMEIALQKMLQEMFPQVPLSRSGIAMLAAEIDALDKNCIKMRGRIIPPDSRKELN